MAKLNLAAEPGTYEIRVTREFNAPRELVYRALTDPALVAQWWGLKSTTTVVDQMEAKPGGIWRYIERDTDGSEYAFHGVYHDLTAPERIIYTFEFEGMPGHVLMTTTTLEEQDGSTTMTESSVFQTVADRDGMLQSGMEEGTDQSLDSLEALLQTLS
jgi:uncharacterized protein YndB with AHSA1/START domain